MSVFEDFPDITVHFSKTVGTKVVNEDGLLMGRLTDYFVDYEEVYPLVLAIQFTKNKQFFYISWGNVKNFNYEKITLKSNAQVGRSRTYPKANKEKVLTSLLASQFRGDTVEYPALGKLVLDKQIVDTSGKKVVRVNDIEFIKTGQHLRVTHAAIGLRSMMRRLGFEAAVDRFVKIVKPSSKYLKKEPLINWKFVHAIPDRSVHSSLKLSLTNEDIQNMHPADLADILEDLDNHARDLIFANLQPELAAETLSEVEHDMQANLIKDASPEDAAKIIENMGTDEAADVLSELAKEKAQQIIAQIEDQEIQEEIQELLHYEEDTAGGLMSTEVFEVSPDLKKSQVLDIIQEEHEDLESIYDIFVVDSDKRLLGSCSLTKLLIQKEDIRIGDIMIHDDIKFLSPDVTWREVASYMSKYNLINVPIVDEKQELLGIVSVDDVLPWLLDER